MHSIHSRLDLILIFLRAHSGGDHQWFGLLKGRSHPNIPKGFSQGKGEA